MRIAVSGSHATGKSTLIDELARRLPSFERVDEPYHQLMEEGHAFADPLGADDYELMFQRSVTDIGSRDSGHVLFDRCPADFLAYLVASHGDRSALGQLAATAASALSRLDLIVYLPIEAPDRINDAGIALPKLRRRVDELLREMLVEDAWGFGVRAIEVRGTLDARIARVRQAVMRHTSHDA
ncbi:MAG TPA: ATP-binding protein [Gemmatimonadales bacterium]|nr:ATP-binding protein [Gemmatimonadales bacterium]